MCLLKYCTQALILRSDNKLGHSVASSTGLVTHLARGEPYCEYCNVHAVVRLTVYVKRPNTFNAHCRPHRNVGTL